MQDLSGRWALAGLALVQVLTLAALYSQHSAIQQLRGVEDSSEENGTAHRHGRRLQEVGALPGCRWRRRRPPPPRVPC